MPAWSPRGRRLGIFDAAKNRDSGLPQDVFDDGFAEARSVVIEHEPVRFFIVTKLVEAVGIGEFAQGSKLLGIEAILKFVGDGHECHAANYSIGLRRVGLETNIAKAQRVGDHRDGTKRHGSAGEDGAQQNSEEGIKNSSCNGNAE